jgi:hypothetical protein
MQDFSPPPPIEDDGGFVPPMEHVPTGPSPGPLLSAGSRKAAKRNFPFDLRIGETIQLVVPPIPARKKPRLGEHLPTSGVAGARRRWTPEEDEKLTSAFTNTPKNKWGTNNWTAVAALLSGRTGNQCSRRWHHALDPSISRATARAGRWTADEDNKLRDAMPAQGRKDWVAISAQVPGRTRIQCSNRWHESLISTIDPAAARAGKWTADEDKKLSDAMPAHGDKDWVEISAQVPGRTRVQCYNRWQDTLVSTIDPAAARTGKWTADEDNQLMGAVPAHGDKDWVAIAAKVPGRRKRQCRKRWHHALDPSIRRATARAGRWTADEDKKLRDAVPAQGYKDWVAIAAKVPGRTRQQCCKRWHNKLKSNVDPTTARAGNWTTDEDKRLSDAVPALGDEDWVPISAQVPGRTRQQCK